MKNLVIASSLLFTLTVKAQEYLPSPLLLLSDYFSHHVIVAEKSTHTLYLYKNTGGLPKLQLKYQMATGKKAGDKIFQGDHRTPEGIYHFTEFLTHQDLLKRHGKAGEIYGVGAFVMNYPNPIDRYQGKTGGGIWLHSTNDETRIDKGLDSRGCIVAHNQNLIKISQFIELNKTPIIVVHTLEHLKKNTWQGEREQIIQSVENWAEAWRTENFNEYISHYSKDKFKDPRKGGYQNFKNYKRAVFANPGAPEIGISNLTILKTDEYAVVTFKQDYKSNTIQDTGKKILYLQKDPYYKWKIVAERWSKLGIESEASEDTLAFEPKLRFFNSEDPKQIFTRNLNLTQTQTQSSN
ncbi:L,D-transpeptidase family protein [Bacteriovorax sp. DB6_IX]|uniref:L,D-transpeptidase family protein n=1 Tax=Bacteriovorax sp. DB6_IX TaxID=1353530 RepID=UPI000389EBE9|nr:L,D-transpeptidase family protein [Bacteriovorax sp. DB6_IX]EQC51137.1 L,D-transpeptidase catalytic domain protein [Bacteriovorax sp. DB6_IX]